MTSSIDGARNVGERISFGAELSNGIGAVDCYVMPQIEPALKLRQVWRRITVSMALTQEEILKEGG